MALSRIATAIGGLLLSRGGRSFAGRHAGKLALATLAYEFWRQNQARKQGAPSPGQSQAQRQATPHARRRWSGRSV